MFEDRCGTTYNHIVNNKVFTLQAHCLNAGGKPDDSDTDKDKSGKAWIWFALAMSMISFVMIAYCYCKKKSDSAKTF